MTELYLESDELQEYLSELSQSELQRVDLLLRELEDTEKDDVRNRAQLIAQIYDLLGLVTDDELDIIEATQNMTMEQARIFIITRGVEKGYITPVEAKELEKGGDLTIAQGFIDGD